LVLPALAWASPPVQAQVLQRQGGHSSLLVPLLVLPLSQQELPRVQVLQRPGVPQSLLVLPLSQQELPRVQVLQRPGVPLSLLAPQLVQGPHR